MLWFDVGFKRYTTSPPFSPSITLLWFDVGFKRYTTPYLNQRGGVSCGLM